MAVKSFRYSQGKKKPFAVVFIDSRSEAKRNPVPFYYKYY